ncbi:MAG: YqaJ viral recombinase family protein [Luteolibacter sp.]
MSTPRKLGNSIIWDGVVQQSEEWFRIRAGRPTASNFDKIITATGKYSSQWDAFAISLTAETVCRDPWEWTGNRHTDRGNEYEPAAREAFAAHLGMPVCQVGFVTRADGIVGCSPDAFVLGADDLPVAGAEIKCPGRDKHAQHLVANALPAEHLQQVHGSMAVTGLDTWHFVSYFPGLPLLVVKVTRDGYTAKVADALDRFLIYYDKRRKEVLPILTGKAAA